MGRRKSKIDLLSGLPDEILFHILSFLPTKLSVSTSVLAKRWKFLWTHVPNLEFHENDFKAKKKKQLDIINRVIILHGSKNLNTFKLSGLKGCAYQLETLIIYLITRGVRNLYLDFGRNLYFDLGYHCEEHIVCSVPRLLLTCKTLVDLRLVNCGEIPSTGELFLPSLKKLNLTYVDYESDESLAYLLSGCPVLEDLIVIGCLREEQKHEGCFTISSPTIKMLNVNFSEAEDHMSEKTLIINVPALIYLKVLCYDLQCVKSLKTMTSLSEAEIIFDENSHFCDIDCPWHGRAIEFLSCLCHVRSLKLSSFYGFPLYDIVGTSSMPKFVNLTKLEFDLIVSWHYIAKFLEVADNLKVLFISTRERPIYKEPKRVPPCMLSCLRTVRIAHFFACENAFDTVRYILRNAQVLEMMEIDFGHSSSSAAENLAALKRISFFERGSKSCQLVFNTN